MAKTPESMRLHWEGKPLFTKTVIKSKKTVKFLLTLFADERSHLTLHELSQEQWRVERTDTEK